MLLKIWSRLVLDLRTRDAQSRRAVFTACPSIHPVHVLTGVLMATLAPVFVMAPEAQAGAPTVPQARPGQPIQGLSPAELQAFNVGKTQYSHTLTAPEGLGPIFNKSSCGNCHNNPTGGPGVQTVTRFGIATKDGFDPLEEFGGSLLQVSSITPECQEFVHPSATHQIFRVTNGALAFGLVEAIPDAALYANEVSPPHPSVSGRVHWVEALEDIGTKNEGTLYAGRFGWKAQVATVLTFSGDAALNEMGLTNVLVQTENDPNGIEPPNLGDPDFCDLVADPEDNLALGNGVDKTFIEVVTDFQRFLAPPPQTPKSGMTGETIFNSAALHCNACHVRTFVTGSGPGIEPFLANQTILPYSDWLLHDMGALTGDGVSQGDAGIYEMKTPPLWGMRKPDRIFLHDGSAGSGTFADRVEDAILAHNGGEAAGIDVAYNNLSQLEKDQLIAFLGSLGRLEFDHSGDDLILGDDFNVFRSCHGGTGYTPDDDCAISDIDQDGDVDDADFDSFLLVYDGTRRDCNNNGVWDLVDIINGTSADANTNTIPDSCEPTCGPDVNGSHGTDIDDLLAVINQWGPCNPVPSPCAADIDANRKVDITDLLVVIGSWGPCP
jgi:CxxC motif-containing protein (DUF1111 family)